MATPNSNRTREAALVVLVGCLGAAAAASGLDVPNGTWIGVIALAWALIAMSWLRRRGKS